MSTFHQRQRTSLSATSEKDILQQCFAVTSPMVACLVRHIDRNMEEVATPSCIERCVVELQSYFQPYIEASRVVDKCHPGSKLRLQFGKAMDINAGASSSLLNLYIFAVDQVYSRPRLLTHVAREWRALLQKTNRGGSCFVMLYHKDLVEAACFSTRKANGETEKNTTKEPDQKKADAAVATLELYFEELKALKFAPHQMCAYLPNEAPIRIVERLRAAYSERVLQLTGAFERYQKLRRCPPAVSQTGSIKMKEWKLHECWGRGFDVAMHHLQFGVLSEAMNIFSSMFAQYYYHSDDYNFTSSVEALKRLGKLSNVFDLTASTSKLGGYPSALVEDADYVEGLLFITGCEMKCALLLGRREAAFARYQLFIQVAREKFAEATSSETTKAWELFFLLRCALSALRLNWGIGECNHANSSNNNNNNNNATATIMTASCNNNYNNNYNHRDSSNSISITNHNNHNNNNTSHYSPSPDPRMAASGTVAYTPRQQHEQQLPVQPQSLGSPTFSDTHTLPADQDWSISAASPNRSYSLVLFPSVCEISENEIKNTAVSLERLRVLSHEVGVEWTGEIYWLSRLLAKLSAGALDILMDLGIILHYREADYVVHHNHRSQKEEEPSTTPSLVMEFDMPELASFGAFNAFYRTLTELSAIGFDLLNELHIAHTLYYRLALSYRMDEPIVAATMCRQRLIPFFLRYGWIQLQIVVYRLYLDSMDLVMQERQAKGEEVLLEKEEATLLKEALLHIIVALNEPGVLCDEISSLCGKQPILNWWFRLKRVDSYWNYAEADPEGQCYDIAFLFREVEVSCIGRDELVTATRGYKQLSITTTSKEQSENEGSEELKKGLRAKIGETVLLCISAACSFDILKCENPAETNVMLTVTLVSKQDWGNTDESLHVLDIGNLVSASHDAEKQQLHWIWEFEPCRAGEYRMHSITLQVAPATTLVYAHAGDSNVFSAVNDIGFPLTPSSTVNSGVKSLTGCLLSVPEPDIGIKMRVIPPEEPHCFSDTLTFFTVQVEVERSLYLSQLGDSVTSSGSSTGSGDVMNRINKTNSSGMFNNSRNINVSGGNNGTMIDANGMGINTCRSCSMEAQTTPSSVPSNKGADVNPVRRSIVPLDLRHFVVETTPQQDPATLAYISVSRPRRQNTVRLVNSVTGVSTVVTRSVRETSLQLDAVLRRADADPSCDAISSRIAITDDKTGAFTIIPVDEHFVMSHLPPVVYDMNRDVKSSQDVQDCDNNNNNNNNNSNSGASGDKNEKRGGFSMRLEGSILSQPKQQCCFKIRLEEDAKPQHEDEEENDGGGSSLANDPRTRLILFGATSLKCSLPVLPLFVSGSDDCAQVSLSSMCNQQSYTTNVSVPFRLAQAFSVRYMFKYFQSRVYCLVEVENVLKKTSLWLRGAMLEFLDSEHFFELSRISSTHESLMIREWKPNEVINLFFELSPSSEPHTHEKELHHRVRLKLLYSNWSIAKEQRSLEPLVLHSRLAPSGIAAGNSTTTTTNTTTTATTTTAFGVLPSGNTVGGLDQYPHSVLNSLENSLVDNTMCSFGQPHLYYDATQLEALQSTCNTFYGPVGKFTSRHSCLFNVVIFVDPPDPANRSFYTAAAAEGSASRCTRKTSLDSFYTRAIPVGTSSVDLPGGYVFPIGEPVRFSVILEPLAHNWPEESASEETFFITFKADPAAWMVTGKQRLRRTLSMMEDEILHFTAVPVPALPVFPEDQDDEVTLLEPQPRLLQQQQQQPYKISTVATPTIEVHWASRCGETVGDTLPENAAVIIDVVQFRTSMRIQH